MHVYISLCNQEMPFHSQDHYNNYSDPGNEMAFPGCIRKCIHACHCSLKPIKLHSYNQTNICRVHLHQLYCWVYNYYIPSNIIDAGVLCRCITYTLLASIPGSPSSRAISMCMTPLFFRAGSKVIHILIALKEGEPGNKANSCACAYHIVVWCMLSQQELGIIY